MRTTLTGAVVALAIVVSACSFGSTSVTTEGPTTPAPPETTTPGGAAAPTTTRPQTTTTEPAGTSSAVDADLLATIDTLIDVTERVRGLAFLEEPTVTIVTEDELAARIRELIEEELDAEETTHAEALWVTLGILDEEVDLAELYSDLYAEQVAGYYDGETKEMVVPSGEELTPLQKLTVVHELIHALTDQHFDFTTRSDQLDQEERYEEAAALQALIEGDASWAELIYLQSVMTAAEQASVFAEAGLIDTETLDSAPDFMRDLLVFPYDFEGGGASFVADLWLVDRSFAPVDDAYRDPPVTTEQIVDPQRYRSREPAIDVQLPETSVAGYEIVDEGIWGQVGFEFLIDQALAAEEAQRASVGWGGDEYRVLWNGENIVFFVLFVGDTLDDNAEMAEVLDAFASAQLPDTSSSYLGTSDEGVLFIVSDGESASALAQEFFPSF